MCFDRYAFSNLTSQHLLILHRHVSNVIIKRTWFSTSDILLEFSLDFPDIFVKVLLIKYVISMSWYADFYFGVSAGINFFGRRLIVFNHGAKNQILDEAFYKEKLYQLGSSTFHVTFRKAIWEMKISQHLFSQKYQNINIAKSIMICNIVQ